MISQSDYDITCDIIDDIVLHIKRCSALHYHLTFSNPSLNTSSTMSLKYVNTQLNVDASRNLTVINGGTSQWTTVGNKYIL